MSLFEKKGYEWRETYLIFFRKENRPAGEIVRARLRGLGDRFELSELQNDENGALESVTITVRGESSAMDVVYTSDEDLTEQLPELLTNLAPQADEQMRREELEAISTATARLDVLHFQKRSHAKDGDDPGSLFLVLETLSHLCHGTMVDPQSACFLTDE